MGKQRHAQAGVGFAPHPLQQKQSIATATSSLLGYQNNPPPSSSERLVGTKNDNLTLQRSFGRKSGVALSRTVSQDCTDARKVHAQRLCALGGTTSSRFQPGKRPDPFYDRDDGRNVKRRMADSLGNQDDIAESPVRLFPSEQRSSGVSHNGEDSSSSAEPEYQRRTPGSYRVRDSVGRKSHFMGTSDETCSIQHCNQRPEMNRLGGRLCSSHACRETGCWRPVNDPGSPLSRFCGYHTCCVVGCLSPFVRPFILRRGDPITHSKSDHRSHNQRTRHALSRGSDTFDDRYCLVHRDLPRPVDSLDLPTSHHQHPTLASAWTEEDDHALLELRFMGKTWEQIRLEAFPLKTSTACKTRHERLTEYRAGQNGSGMDSRKFESGVSPGLSRNASSGYGFMKDGRLSGSKVAQPNLRFFRVAERYSHPPNLKDDRLGMNGAGRAIAEGRLPTVGEQGVTHVVVRRDIRSRMGMVGRD